MTDYISFHLFAKSIGTDSFWKKCRNFIWSLHTSEHWCSCI